MDLIRAPSCGCYTSTWTNRQSPTWILHSVIIEIEVTTKGGNHCRSLRSGQLYHGKLSQWRYYSWNGRWDPLLYSVTEYDASGVCRRSPEQSTCNVFTFTANKFLRKYSLRGSTDRLDASCAHTGARWKMLRPMTLHDTWPPWPTCNTDYIIWTCCTPQSSWETAVKAQMIRGVPKSRQGSLKSTQAPWQHTRDNCHHLPLPYWWLNCTNWMLVSPPTRHHGIDRWCPLFSPMS